MYKIILFNHGETAANGRVLLDTSSGENPGLTQAVVETKLNEAGSFNYSIVPTHPLYGMTSPLKVYVSVEEDGTEIFYGRILSVQTNPLTKIKSVTCEGALAFLLDCELPKDSDDRTSTAANYFTYCVGKYNEGIQNDANRLLKVGVINVAGVSETHSYNNGSFTQIQNVLKSQLLNAHDGFFRIRRDDSTGEHYIDWVEQVGQTNPQAIAITHNVINQTNTESGEDIFSIMRPVGNDDLTLSGTGLIPVSQSMVDDYGPIIRTVTFDAGDANTLQAKALDYIEKIKNRLTIIGDISFVDFHFLDGSSPKVHVGDVFTNIEGYEGTKLTAESVSRNLLDAGKDKLSIKSDKELMSSAVASGANSSNVTGVKAGRKASSGSAHMYKFYHETQTDASLAAKNLFISAEEKIETRAQSIEIYADEIDERLSEEIGKVKVNTDSLQTEWTTYKGTEIYRNKDHIDQVCGLYQVQEYTDPQTGKTVKNLVVQEGSALYQTHDGVIMGVYDNYNLTGGMMVDKINGQTKTLIKGDLVNIGDANSKVKLSDKITVVDGGTLIKGLVMFKASDSATNSVSINNGKVTAETVQPTTLTFHGSGGEDDYVNLGYATVANMLTNAEVDTANNLLKIWKIGDAANNPSITFSKATSLSGTWSGGSLPKTLTVTASPQGNTYQVQFDGTYSATRTNLEVSLGGSVSIETVMGAKMLSIPVNISRLTGTSSAPDIIYQTNISAAYNALLETRSVSANGTYTPGSDYIGIGSIKVTVPNTMLVDAATGTATIGTGGSSSLTFSAGITYSSATHTYIARAIVDGVDMEPRRAASGTEAYTDGKTDGHGEMGIEADAQNSLVKVVQGSTKSLSITIPSPTFSYDDSTHEYRVQMTAKAGDTAVATATSLNTSGVQAYNDGIDDCWDTVGIASIYNTTSLPSGETVAGQFTPGRYYRISPQAKKSDGQYHVNGVGWYYAPDTASGAYDQGKTDGYNLYHNSVHHMYVVGSPHVEVNSGLQFWTVSIRDVTGTELKRLNGNYDGDNSTGLIAVGKSLYYNPTSSKQEFTVNDFVNTVTVYAGEKHTKSYEFYCSKRTPLGGGQFDYVLEGTFGSDLCSKVGATPTLWK